MFRRVTESDLENVLKIYNRAREFMAKTGNPTQWKGGYPSGEILLSDIEKEQLFLCEENGKILGVFVFFLGDDPTYSHIDGNWISNEPYGVIHRIASSGESKGFFGKALGFCKEQTRHIRIDTHSDNLVMQKTLVKHGFLHCGTIYLENGDPRLAFEYIE